MSDLPAPQTWETMFVLRGLKPPSEPSEYLQLDYIQLPLSGGYQYVLTICMFSGWPGDFCCKVHGFVKGSSLTPCWICVFNLCFPLLLFTKRILCPYIMTCLGEPCPSAQMLNQGAFVQDSVH